MARKLVPVVKMWSDYNADEYRICVVDGNFAFECFHNFAFFHPPTRMLDLVGKELPEPVKLRDDIVSVFALNNKVCYVSEKGDACDTEYNPVEIPAKTTTINTDDSLFLKMFTQRSSGVFDKDGNIYAIMENRFPTMTCYVLVHVDSATGNVLNFTRPFYMENQTGRVYIIKASDDGMVWLAMASEIFVVDFTKML
jgi:hypothetical protein